MIIALFVSLTLVSLLVAVLIYRAEPSRSAWLAVWIWITSLFSFFMQGLAEATDTLVPFSIAATFPNWFVCIRLLETLYDQRFHLQKLMIWFFLVSIAAGAALSVAGFGAEVVSFPVALGQGIPFCVLAIFAWRRVRNRTAIDSLLFINLLILGVHLLDYPFFRFKPEFMMFGFGVAFFNSFVNSVLIPVIVTAHIRDGYEATLKKAVDDATNELSKRNAELVDAKNEIQTLLSVVCHDISNSLMVADFSVENSRKMLSEQNPAHEVLANLEKAEAASANVRSLVENVRFLQKFSTQEEAVRMEPVQISDLIESSIGMLSHVLTGKAIIVKRKLQCDKAVLGFRTYTVNSVFNNVLSNAVKFSHPGASIEIRSYEQDPFLIVEISDHGVGIAPDILPHVFSPAQSASTAGTAGEAGTGFGLPIVKAVMEVIGGDVDIRTRHESEFPESHGTTVVLKFRLAHDHRNNFTG